MYCILYTVYYVQLDALTLWLVYVLVVVGCAVYATLTTQYPTYAVHGDGLAWCHRRWAARTGGGGGAASSSPTPPPPPRLADATLVALALCNNLLMPLVVELFVSPQCLRYVVSPAPALQFAYDTAVILNFARG
eukprot:gene14148-10101_t